MKPIPLVRTLGFLCLAFAQSTFGSGESPSPPSHSEHPDGDAVRRQISEAAFASIVRVERWDATQKGELVRLSTSTGFFVEESSPLGEWILTVIPDLRDSDLFRVEVRRSMIQAKVVARDPLTSLTLLTIAPSENQARAKLAAKSDRTVGSLLFLVDGQTSAGQLAAVARVAGRESLGPFTPTMLRVNQPQNAGQWGSPLFNRDGGVAGMVCRPVPNVPDAVLAIPAEQLAKFVADVKRYGQPAPPWLGIVVNDQVLSPRLEGVRPDSPAHEAGLVTGDIIVSLDGREIATLQDLLDAACLLPLDRAVDVKVLRGQEMKPLKITARLKQ